MESQKFFLTTALAKGLRELFQQLEKAPGIDRPVAEHIAGGMAVHLYTSGRVTSDVDAEFGAKIAMPRDLAVEVTLEDGAKQIIYFDTNYNSSFALMHEDYLDDAAPIDFGLNHFKVYVLSPVDLAVSKIARFADNDKDDIAQLVRLGLTSSDAIEARATHALGGFVGRIEILKLNLRDALQMTREIEQAQQQEVLPPEIPG